MTIHFWIFALAQLPLWETSNLVKFQKIIPIQFLPPPDKYPPPTLHTKQIVT